MNARNVYPVEIAGELVDVAEPTSEELQAFRLFPRELKPQRQAEIAAYVTQVRLRTSSADRRWLSTLRITAPADFATS